MICSRHASGLTTDCTVTLNPDTVLPSDLPQARERDKTRWVDMLSNPDGTGCESLSGIELIRHTSLFSLFILKFKNKDRPIIPNQNKELTTQASKLMFLFFLSFSLSPIGKPR